MILFSFRKVKFRNTWPFDFHIQNQEASQDYSPVSEDFIGYLIRENIIKVDPTLMIEAPRLQNLSQKV